MKVKTIKILCGVLTMLAFSACSSNIDDADGNHPQFWHVTLQASMGDETTRALSEVGNVITARFEMDDRVKVLKSDGSELCELIAQSSGTSTTLVGTISGSIADNDVLTLRYRSATANYDGQVGTLAGIAASQDCEEGALTVKTTSPELTFTSNHVTLAAKQSITKFSFTCGGNAVSVKTFGIAAVGLVQSIAADATSTETIGAVTGTLSSASSEVYVALRNNSGANQTYSFTVKDNDGNWYTGMKNAKLTNGKNYTATVTLTKWIDKDQKLTTSSAVGTIGVVGELPAIVVEINSTKKAVALMNAGALCPEAYGKYYTFAELSSAVSDGWYVPTQAELNALAGITSTWGTQNGVNGRLFTISEGKTLFLPAAGLDDGDNNPQDFIFVSTEGYYWSSTNYAADLAYVLNLDNDPSFSVKSLSWYKVDGLTVRPFHELN